MYGTVPGELSISKPNKQWGMSSPYTRQKDLMVDSGVAIPCRKLGLPRHWRQHQQLCRRGPLYGFPFSDRGDRPRSRDVGRRVSVVQHGVTCAFSPQCRNSQQWYWPSVPSSESNGRLLAGAQRRYLGVESPQSVCASPTKPHIIGPLRWGVEIQKVACRVDRLMAAQVTSDPNRFVNLQVNDVWANLP